MSEQIGDGIRQVCALLDARRPCGLEEEGLEYMTSVHA